MKQYALKAESAVETDVEAAFDWYEGEEPGLGLEFLAELRAAYERIVDQPLGYQDRKPTHLEEKETRYEHQVNA